VQVIAPGEPGLFEAAADFICRFIRPPRGFAPTGWGCRLR
jgi:hypothetical protein